MRPKLLAGLTLMTVGVFRHAAAAQVRVEIGPYIGLYAPTASFGSAPFASPIQLPASSRQSTAALAGAKAAIWIGAPVGLAVQWGTASSAVRTRDEASREMEQPARVTVGAVQLLVPLKAPFLRGRGHVHASGGIGLMRRSGEFYEVYDDVRNASGIVGLGSDIAISGPVHVTLDFEAYLYSLQLRQPGTTPLESSFQTDLLARLGLVLRLGPHDDVGD
jgi:hypothetical protein